jgi:hypothetical protein
VAHDSLAWASVLSPGGAEYGRRHARILTAAIASRFVRQDAEVELADVMEVLERIEADVAELKAGQGRNGH